MSNHSISTEGQILIDTINEKVQVAGFKFSDNPTPLEAHTRVLKWGAEYLLRMVEQLETEGIPGVKQDRPADILDFTSVKSRKDQSGG